MQLPIDLGLAIEEETARWSEKDLARAVEALSKRYRSGRTAGRTGFLHSEQDVAAYAAFRMPATFAAVHAALVQTAERLPGWQPRRLLDVGAGLAAATWAAVNVFAGLEEATLLERDPDMIALGKRLAQRAHHPVLPQATWIPTDLTGPWESSPHDLVVVAYVLGELPSHHGAELVKRLWELTSGTLVLVEPGTPAGYRRIIEARDFLLAQGAHVVAPCPHRSECPMAHDDWCHFSQRVERSRRHRVVKKGELSYEDEKFSYVSVSRMEGTALSARVVRHPQVRKGHIGLSLCTADGRHETVTVTKKDREAFRRARDARWGTAMD